MNKTKDRRAGFYFIDEIPYVSVTHVLEVINKPQIQYWFGQQVYYAVAKDPSISEKEALAAPYRTSKKAKMRGSDIHTMIENYKQGAKLPEEFTGDNEFAGYANAFLSFLADHPNFETLEHERTVVNKEQGYAGTLDTIAKLGDRTIIMDVKTNKDANIYDEVEPQLSAYQRALGVDYPTFVLALGADGQYTFKQTLDRYEQFLSCLNIWIWKNESKCKAVGYIRKR